MRLGGRRAEEADKAEQLGKSEDDGWILSYVFDESQLGKDGNADQAQRVSFGSLMPGR